MMEIVKLKNGLRFVVLSKLELDGEKYMYLTSYDEDANYIFVRVDGKKLEPIVDGEIISRLANLIVEKYKKEVNQW